MPSRELRRAVRKKQSKPHEEQKEKKKQNRPFLYLFSVVILIVIVVTFVGLPVASNIGGGDRLILGYYADRPIEFRYGNYFAQQTQILADQYRQSTSQDNYADELFRYRVWRGAFERTVIHEGILDEVETSGLEVTDDLIGKRVNEYGIEKFESASNSEKANLTRRFRESLKEERFIEDYFDNQHVSDGEKEFVKQMATPERNFRYVYFSFDEFPEEMVIDYAEENIRLFERIKLSKITIDSSEADAEQIHQQVMENPGMFAELARTQSIDTLAEKGGEMDWKMYYELEPEFPSTEALNEVFDLEIDGISDVVETVGSPGDPTDDTASWTIYKCDSPAVTPDVTEEETIATVRSYMERYEGGMIEDYLLEKADAFIADTDGNDFMAAAAENGLTPDLTDYFPINYGNSFFLKPVKSVSESDVLSGAAYNDDFFVAAFSLGEQEISEPVILNDYIIVLQMIDEREAPEDQLQQIDYYYPRLVRQYRDEALRNYFLKSDKLEDNFNQAFAKTFQSDS